MQIILVLHNIMRWAVLFFAIWTLIKAFKGLQTQSGYTVQDNRTNLFFMISCDIQLLLGLALYFFNSWSERLGSGMGEIMKNKYDRFFTVEHGFVMILAWILVHVGRTAVKKSNSDVQKHKKTLIYVGIALLLILISIPWPFREAIAKPWFRWLN